MASPGSVMNNTNAAESIIHVLWPGPGTPTGGATVVFPASVSAAAGSVFWK